VLGVLVSLALTLLIGVPVAALSGPSEHALIQDPASVGEPAEDVAGGSLQDSGVLNRSSAGTRLVPRLPLADQAGGAQPYGPYPGRTSRRALTREAPHHAVRRLAGGPGAAQRTRRQTRSAATRQADRNRRVTRPGRRPRDVVGQRLPTRISGRQTASPVGRSRGPVDRLTVDLGILFTTQFDGSRYANSNCTMAAAAMLYEVQTGRSVSGAQLRRWSGARTRGTGLLEIERAFRRGHQPVTTYEDFSWRRFLTEVRSGRSAVVMGWYGYLPDRYVLQKGFRTAHSVFVLGYSAHAFKGRGGFFVMDPLGRQGYGGQWWTRTALWRFGWKGDKGVRGSGPRSFRGTVAFQVNRTPKQLGARAVQPRFRSYWATTKELLRRSQRVDVVVTGQRRLGPNLGNTGLRIQDRPLQMDPRKAARRNLLRWPLLARGRLIEDYSRRHRSLTVGIRRGARVVASAPGRVIYRSWNKAGQGNTLYVMHGKRLFTYYGNLSNIQVTVGQWVARGTVLGQVAGTGKRRQVASRVQFGVVTSSKAFVRYGRVNPRAFLPAFRAS
jgi:murein DD-endopeptidase MepM/ murein hydrolase activator NlpD